jgi:hypothetical protein
VPMVHSDSLAALLATFATSLSANCPKYNSFLLNLILTRCYHMRTKRLQMNDRYSIEK